MLIGVVSCMKRYGFFMILDDKKNGDKNVDTGDWPEDYYKAGNANIARAEVHPDANEDETGGGEKEETV